MAHETTKIELPPPRMIKRRRSGLSRPVWIVCLVVALILGGGAGVFIGQKYNEDRKSGKGSGVSGTNAPPDEQKVTRLLGEARSSVEEGDWLKAREIFQEVVEIDPGNPHAVASLPLIERRLAEIRGSILIETNPPGAEVSINGLAPKVSPAEFSNVPVGKHVVEVRMEGYEPFTREIEVDGEERVTIPEIVLTQSAGQLEVVSEPKGAEFKVLKKEKDDLKELVQAGTTPAKIEKLDPGEYQVLMVVEGWPEYSESIKVEHNRNTSVSAVFAKGGLRVTSDPIGAEVWLTTSADKSKKVGTTPCNLTDLPVGKHRIELRYEDWSPIRRTVEVSDGVTQDLVFEWERALVTFISDPPGVEVFQDNQRVGNGLKLTPFTTELPEGEYSFTAKHHTLGAISRSVFVDGESEPQVNFQFEYASVQINSNPQGAAVVSNGTPMGRTPLMLQYVKPGGYTYEISLKNYRSSIVSGKVEPGGSLKFNATLKFDPSPSTTRSFDNGLGQRMVWFGSLNGWVAATETTQEQYQRIAGTNPSYFKAPNHPVDTVTWYKAVQYCEALTVQERGLGNIPEGYRYRLPTDEEWTELAGNAGLDQAVVSLYQRQSSTAPVASLPSNEYGLFDVRGNVMEWCQDWYSQSVIARARREGAPVNESWVGTDRKVLRGGSWNRSSQIDLSLENRVAARPSAEDRYDVGFRVILMAD